MPRLQLTGRIRALIVALAVVVFVVAAVALVNSTTGPSGRTLASFFEDDNLLVNQQLTPAGDLTVAKTLLRLKSLGVDRIRVIVLWAAVAQGLSVKPVDSSSPAAYSPCGWALYDRIDQYAHRLGIGVYFDVTAPGPAWAMHPGASGSYVTHYAPDAQDFEQFVEALGSRYGGGYRPTGVCPGSAFADDSLLPRVSFWSLWNEPNQPGWLAPQYTAGGQPIAPALYRAYTQAFWQGLTRTGHSPPDDKLLIGELAPEGCLPGRFCGYPGGPTERPIPPITFLQGLYCVDARFRVLRGAAATAVGCPATGATSSFVATNPGLFQISGFAHHPYSLLLAPGRPLPERTYVPLANLGRLEHALDAIFRSYGVDTKLPVYLTEYGYVTNPPNPVGVSLARQALYLDEGEYLAYQDPRVRALSQFELQDAPPSATGSYRGTFQEGLEFINGTQKPSYAAYRLPIYVPDPNASPLLVWAMLRPASNGTTQTATIQWRPPGGSYRVLQSVTTTNPSGFLSASVRPPGSGLVRVVWQRIASRPVAVK